MLDAAGAFAHPIARTSQYDRIATSLLNDVQNVNDVKLVVVLNDVKIRHAGGVGYEAPMNNGRYHHGNLKEALVAAALDLVREGGHAALSMRAVGKRAGVSGAAAYHHFKDKEALLAEVLTWGYGRALSMVRADCDAIDDPFARLDAMGRAYIGFALSEPVLFRMMFGAIKPGPNTYQEMDEAGSCLFSYLVDNVQVLIDQGGTLDTDPVRLAMTIWSSVHGFAVLIADGAREKEEFGITTQAAFEATLDALLVSSIRGVMATAVRHNE